ncbi:MAG: hypothetical protein ACD_48C00353G0001 [uncultured bacterium]|nr:MAG: hypothetical protein ACD_48C00353G0001 [uncultured bacterium]
MLRPSKNNTKNIYRLYFLINPTPIINNTPKVIAVGNIQFRFAIASAYKDSGLMPSKIIQMVTRNTTHPMISRRINFFLFSFHAAIKSSHPKEARATTAKLRRNIIRDAALVERIGTFNRKRRSLTGVGNANNTTTPIRTKKNFL